ncbi:MAG TPA: selenocysteine-specific translation elongation factor [Bacillales bacterium]|nr:selenocysteine-specific translation elongation factor [Bacillales bacterium]
MEKRYYTVGMAGHIDHGKTELTKALTQVDTDRLKEEKQRGVSIELGYAPFQINEDMQVSIIDVPGHEKFIRQMIAGVAGIDLVVLVIAADEGVMPQTEEHIEILSFLGIREAVIAITKVDKVDDELLELVQEDVKEATAGTSFESANIVCVDSVSKRGIPELTKTIEEKLAGIPEKNANGPFRLPIDQVFTIQGQGTVVRGTVFEGMVKESDTLKVLPQNKEVRVRQLQVQHERMKEARAGQRAALNLGGISRNDLGRGDVLVSSHHYLTTQRLDVSIRAVGDLAFPLKQRAPVKIHIGTAIVMGRIIFFDRKRLESGDHILCQLELEEPVVAKREERFIVRRPTPMETIGGGWVIDAQAEKHRFGDQTVAQLKKKKEGTPEDRIIDVLRDIPVQSEQELLQQTGLEHDALTEALHSLQRDGKVQEMTDGSYAPTDLLQEQQDQIIDQLKDYHDRFPLRAGVDKAEIVQSSSVPAKMTEAVIEALKKDGRVRQHGQFLALADFSPAFPEQWAKRMKEVTTQLKTQQLQVETWDELTSKQNLPEDLREDLKRYLLQQGLAYKLDDERLVHKDALSEAVQLLLQQTEDTAFALKQAKDTLGLSRKYLIPFLELLDRLRFTVRDGNERKWVKSTVDEYFG